MWSLKKQASHSMPMPMPMPMPMVTLKCCPRNAPSHVTSAAARIRLLLADTFAIIEASIASRCPARVSLLDGKKPWAPMCLVGLLRPAIMAAIARSM